MPNVDEPIEVVPYDPRWPVLASAEIRRLEDALDAWFHDLRHMGGTSVPGCDSKPIVDILVGTRPDLREIVAEALGESGYERLADAAPGRTYLRRRDAAQGFNAHVVEWDGDLWRDNLALRDYLREHPDERDTYAAAKRSAGERAPTLLAYSREKEVTLVDILARARCWSEVRRLEAIESLVQLSMRREGLDWDALENLDPWE